MSTIEQLFSEIEQLKSNNSKLVGAIQTKLQVELNTVFADWQALRLALVELESTKNFGLDEYSEIYGWVRLDELNEVPENQREYLESYVSENFFVQVDFEHGALKQSQGEYIAINDDGDVYEGPHGKFFIAVKDYTDDQGEIDLTLRNQLIENYMEKTGHFPGVFEIDRYGNIELINTQVIG